MRKGFSILSLLISVSIMLVVAGIFLPKILENTNKSIKTYTDLQNTNTTSTPEAAKSTSSKVSGSVAVYRQEGNNLIIKLDASSTKGKVTKMQVWTDIDSKKVWIPFTQFHFINTDNIDNTVYAQYQDEHGNLSETYSDTTDPPQGPPDAPDI